MTSDIVGVITALLRGPASILALKNFMQQNENHKNKILALVEPLTQSENEFAKVLYNLIQEEAMYL